MILRSDRQSLVRRIRAWPARHGPAFENAVYFQTQIPMQSCDIMFLYDEEIALGLGPFPTRLSGFGKVALGVVAAEGVGCFRHGSGLLPPGCWLLRRRLLCRSLFGGGLSRGSLEIGRAEEHTSELQSLMRISYAVFC